ncbi:MAG: hypothetical protein NT016_01750 [Candidatus Aenigmarchaeota archaeon]|nr:hypothetical protein [Candidatus Aenigmarchaeota archaeon]
MSEKKHVMLTIDGDVLDSMRQRESSISAWVEEQMRAHLARKEKPVTPAVVAEVDALIVKVNDTEGQLAKLKAELLGERASMKQSALLDKYDDVLELRTVTAEQLANGQFAQDLVGVIRGKYPERPELQRASVTELRDYVAARDTFLKEAKA